MTTFRLKCATLLIDILQEVYPNVFPKKPFPKVPLAIGIDKELIPICAKWCSDEKDVQNALKLWCMGRRYYKACMVVGSPRYSLQGAKGAITDNDAKYANHLLREWDYDRI